MSIAQKLKQEGRQQGRLEGREEGHLEGLQEGSRREALRIAGSMLQNGLDKEMVQRLPDCRLMNYSRCVVNVLPRQPLPGTKIRRQDCVSLRFSPL